MGFFYLIKFEHEVSSSLTKLFQSCINQVDSNLFSVISNNELRSVRCEEIRTLLLNSIDFLDNNELEFIKSRSTHFEEAIKSTIWSYNPLFNFHENQEGNIFSKSILPFFINHSFFQSMYSICIENGLIGSDQSFSRFYQALVFGKGFIQFRAWNYEVAFFLNHLKMIIKGPLPNLNYRLIIFVESNQPLLLNQCKV